MTEQMSLLGEKPDIEIIESEVAMDEYLETCVDVPQFLEYCKQCTNYNHIWSCPPFSFDPVEYMKGYGRILFVGYKIIIPEEKRQKTYTKKEQEVLMKELLSGPKKALDADMLERERNHPGSKALSGGSCLSCDPGKCAKLEGKPCRYPEKMRYSVEALGGNVGLTVTKYLHQNLEWIEEGHLPGHFLLLGGLMLP